MDNNMLFPIETTRHLIFVAAALILFIAQYIRQRKKYQLVFAIAIPATLLPYLSDHHVLFSVLGVLEFAALIAALVFARTIDRDPVPTEADGSAEAAAEASAEVIAETPADAPAEASEDAE